MNRRIIFIALAGILFLPCKKLLAQEELVPLQYNNVIKQYLRQHLNDNPSDRSVVCDTLLLPFVDDFSHPGIYPDACLWMDSATFVNDDFADDPPTFGVATF